MQGMRTVLTDNMGDMSLFVAFIDYAYDSVLHDTQAGRNRQFTTTTVARSFCPQSSGRMYYMYCEVTRLVLVGRCA